MSRPRDGPCKPIRRIAGFPSDLAQGASSITATSAAAITSSQSEVSVALSSSRCTRLLVLLACSHYNIGHCGMRRLKPNPQCHLRHTTGICDGVEWWRFLVRRDGGASLYCLTARADFTRVVISSTGLAEF